MRKSEPARGAPPRRRLPGQAGLRVPSNRTEQGGSDVAHPHREIGSSGGHRGRRRTRRSPRPTQTARFPPPPPTPTVVGGGRRRAGGVFVQAGHPEGREGQEEKEEGQALVRSGKRSSKDKKKGQCPDGGPDKKPDPARRRPTPTVQLPTPAAHHPIRVDRPPIRALGTTRAVIRRLAGSANHRRPPTAAHPRTARLASSVFAAPGGLRRPVGGSLDRQQRRPFGAHRPVISLIRHPAHRPTTTAILRRPRPVAPATLPLACLPMWRRPVGSTLGAGSGSGPLGTTAGWRRGE